MLPSTHSLQTGLGDMLAEHLQSQQDGHDAFLRTFGILGSIQAVVEVAGARAQECDDVLNMAIEAHSRAQATHDLPSTRAVRRTVQAGFAMGDRRGILEPVVEQFVDGENLRQRVER